MKLKNRIMSWILSPGAYMVWHALGTPEEWASSHLERGQAYHITHTPTNTSFWTASGTWFFDGSDEWKNTLGLIDRHLVWPRARRVVKYLIREKYYRGYKSKNHELFVKFTQLTGKQP